jgi:hypothetical protein
MTLAAPAVEGRRGRPRHSLRIIVNLKTDATHERFRKISRSTRRDIVFFGKRHSRGIKGRTRS